MSKLSQEQITALGKLREPFPPEQIGKLPKGGVTLDYVGHAALTARLLDVDPEWSWEPVAVDERGLPVFDENGGLWIRLTIAGMTRLGYGDASGKKGANAVKEAIGDALRNAGMRFGAALDLWSKEDLRPPDPLDVAMSALRAAVSDAGIDPARFAVWAKDDLGLDLRTCTDVQAVDGLTRRVQAEGASILGGAG